MISITKGLEHMAWSNQMIFDELAKLPEDIYGLRAAEGEWPVGKILNHFLNAAEWFRYCLTGEKWSDLPKIQTHEILKESQLKLAKLDLVLINESLKPDAEITFQDESGPVNSTRSVVLTQAIVHTAEHKGQLSTILKANGYQLDLDKFDVWSFPIEPESSRI